MSSAWSLRGSFPQIVYGSTVALDPLVMLASIAKDDEWAVVIPALKLVSQISVSINDKDVVLLCLGKDADFKETSPSSRFFQGSQVIFEGLGGDLVVRHSLAPMRCEGVRMQFHGTDQGRSNLPVCAAFTLNPTGGTSQGVKKAISTGTICAPFGISIFFGFLALAS